jgi:hypothetical protein
MQWTRPDTSDEQLRQDSADCRQWAWGEAWRRSWFYPRFPPVVARDALGRPVWLWDDPRFPDPFDDRFLEESRLANQCLRSRGYELVPAEGAR